MCKTAQHRALRQCWRRASLPQRFSRTNPPGPSRLSFTTEVQCRKSLSIAIWESELRGVREKCLDCLLLHHLRFKDAVEGSSCGLCAAFGETLLSKTFSHPTLSSESETKPEHTTPSRWTISNTRSGSVFCETLLFRTRVARRTVALPSDHSPSTWGLCQPHTGKRSLGSRNQAPPLKRVVHR